MPVREYLGRPNIASFPFVFVVTYGRSGSTLLQAILNSIPGYCIRGENYSSLFYLYVATQHLTEVHRKFGTAPTTPSASWFGADLIQPKVFLERVSDVFFDTCLRPPKDTRCVGFKEIRYLEPNICDAMFPDYLDFMQRAFPGAALIFNVRNVNDASASGWWQAREPTLVRKQMSMAIDRFQNYASGRSNCLIFDYDSLMANPAYGETLFNFLGEPYDHASIEAVLARRHGYPTVPLTEKSVPARNAAFSEGGSLSIEAARIASLRRRLEEMSAQNRSLRRDAAALERTLVSARRALSDTQRQLKRKNAEVSRLARLLAAMRNSRSWRLTEPFRRLRLLQRRSS